MAYKTVKAQCPHEDKHDSKKTHWPDVGKFLVDEETYDWLVAHNKRITFFPSFIPGASYSASFREWGDKDDPGDGRGGKW